MSIITPNENNANMSGSQCVSEDKKTVLLGVQWV
jgi:hypothetical protein